MKTAAGNIEKMYRSASTDESRQLDVEMSESVTNPLQEEHHDLQSSIRHLLDLKTYSTAYQTTGLADGVDEIVGGVKQVEEAVKDVLEQEVTEVCK